MWVQCERHQLVNMTIARLKSYPTASMQLLARVSGFVQRDDGVEVTVETPSGTQFIRGSYLIGCDGGRSFGRKALNVVFEGYTHPGRFLVLTTPFSFDAEFAQCSRNYFSDPDEWSA